MIIHCLYDKLAHPRDLKAHPKNRNKHPPDQIKRLAEILEYQGWRYPIKVSKQSGFITSGHGRLEAAKLMNWTEVPVNYQNYDSGDQEYADVQADNAIAAWSELDLSTISSDLDDLGPDFNIDILGIKDFSLNIEQIEPQCDEDEVPEQVEPKTKLGDIYQLGRHRLMCGDSTSIDSVEKLMNGEKADMVFTDPPYNMETSGRGAFAKAANKLEKQLEGLVDFDPTDFLNVLPAIFEDRMSAFIFCNKDLVPNYLNWAIGCKYNFNILTWHKTSHIPFTSGSHYPDTEYCLFLNKRAIFNAGLSPEHYRKYWITEKTEKEFGHPTQKPIQIIELQIEGWSSKTGNVIDLFGGSGSTLIACEKTNRKCFMMELDPKYCDVIVARWEKYTGKKAELLDG